MTIKAEETSSTGKDIFLYTCITCLQPNQALYKQYSTAKNIKLQTCPVCCRDVDPYIERELLLVVMDMMLVRDCAYRHLFFNRSHALNEKHQDKSKASSGGDSGMYSLKNGILGAAVCVLLRLSLKVQGSYISNDKDLGSLLVDMEIHPTECFWQVLPLLHASMVQFAALWMGTMSTAYLCQRWLFVQSSKATQQSILEPTAGTRETRLFWKQMNLAIIIPQLFHFVTLFVHIYENSLMVRLIGSVFVSCFSYMATYTVVERRTFQSIQHESNAESHSHEEIIVPKKVTSMFSGLPFLFGLGIEFSILLMTSGAASAVPMHIDEFVAVIRSLAK